MKQPTLNTLSLEYFSVSTQCSGDPLQPRSSLGLATILLGRFAFTMINLLHLVSQQNTQTPYSAEMCPLPVSRDLSRRWDWGSDSGLEEQVLWFKNKMSPKGTCVWTPHPQPVVRFKKLWNQEDLWGARALTSLVLRTIIRVQFMA